jgi:hypothetical protein
VDREPLGTPKPVKAVVYLCNNKAWEVSFLSLVWLKADAWRSTDGYKSALKENIDMVKTNTTLVTIPKNVTGIGFYFAMCKY